MGGHPFLLPNRGEAANPEKKWPWSSQLGQNQVNAEKKPNQASLFNNTATSHKDSMWHRSGLQQVPSEDESHPGLFHQ